jgi:hypothetical protein
MHHHQYLYPFLRNKVREAHYEDISSVIVVCKLIHRVTITTYTTSMQLTKNISGLPDSNR